MDEFDINDFINAICLRNQLIVVPTEQLIDVCKDSDKFLIFLDTLSVLTSIDSAFFLFSNELIDKVETVISKYRFNYKDVSVIEAINQAIMYFNMVKNYDESYRNLLKNNYLAYHEDCRKTTIEDEKVFFESLAYDAIVYYALAENEMDTIEDSDAYFLASVNYFIEAIPELFDDEEIKDRTLSKLNELTKKGWPFSRTNRIYSKETIQNIQKIKRREE